MKCLQEYYVGLARNAKMNFIFDNCWVQSPSSSHHTLKHFKGDRFIKLTIEFELESFESLSDSPIITRARYLNILGILSYLINEPLDVFGPSASSKVSPGGLKDVVKIQTRHFSINGHNFIEYLNPLIDTIEKLQPYERELIFSILDRWRKAYYLEKENEPSLLHFDEATLAYFHVLELLANVYGKSLKTNINRTITEFVNKFHSDRLSLSDIVLESENALKSKLVSEILAGDISIASKITFMLKSLSLQSDRVEYLLKYLIEARNSVAHGRRVYYDKAVFPVQPFYPLIRNSIYPLEVLRLFIARVISSHLKIDNYEEEWLEMEENLIASDKLARKILLQKKYLKLKRISDLNNDFKNIVFGGVNHFVRSKVFDANEVEEFYRHFLKLAGNKKRFLVSNIDAIVMLYEASKSSNLDKILLRAIGHVDKKNWSPYFRFRDMRYYLGFIGVETPRLKQLIVEKKIR